MEPTYQIGDHVAIKVGTSTLFGRVSDNRGDFMRVFVANIGTYEVPTREIESVSTDEQIARYYWKEMNPGMPLHESCVPGLASMVSAIRMRHPELRNGLEFLCWVNSRDDEDAPEEDE